MLDIFKIQKLSQLSFKDKTGLSLYPWKNCKPRQSSAPSKPLSECKVAIVSSAGLYVRDLHEKFDHKVRGGDYTCRIISHDANLKHLADGQRSNSYNHSGIRQDSSTGMPNSPPFRNAEFPEPASSSSRVPSEQCSAMAVWARLVELPDPVPKKLICISGILLSAI